MTAPATASLDHVVVNTLRGMDAAAGIFSGLGFTLTPLGRHSLGSINHLMMAPGAYLELVGLPETGKQRQEVIDSPFGLSGVVFKTADADQTYAHLKDAGLDPSGPVAFSRPVEIDGKTLDAKFRTVKVPGTLFPAGRVYFCEHLTPELVWRSEWLDHPNGFCGIERVEVVSASPEIDAARYAAAVGVEPTGPADRPTVLAGGFRLDIVPGASARFASMDLAFQGLDRIEAAATATAGVEWSRLPDGSGLIAIPSLELRIACRNAQ